MVQGNARFISDGVSRSVSILFPASYANMQQGISRVKEGRQVTGVLI